MCHPDKRTTFSLTNNLFYHTFLTELISDQKWEKAHDTLKSDHYDKIPCKEAHLLLHLAFQYHPPYFFLQAFIQAYPNAAFETDHMKRYPLHIAAKHGTYYNNINTLLRANPIAAGAVDSKGQTPLYMVFHDYKMKTKSNMKCGSEFERDTIRICKSLCMAAPKSVLVEVDEVSVIEHALNEGADLRVVTALQLATERAQEIESYQIHITNKEKQTMHATKDLKGGVDIFKMFCISPYFSNNINAQKMRQIDARTA